jgi:predicted outer membrane repeat protein
VKGGGIYNVSSTGLIITYCTVTNNQAYQLSQDEGGGGGALYNHSSSAIVSHCLISNNTAASAGMAWVTKGNAAGVYNYSSTCKFSNTTFSNNVNGNGSGGAMVNESSSIEIADCIFTDNSAQTGSGGIVNTDTFLTVSRCDFSGNKTSFADSGGAISQKSSSSGTMDISNCTFFSNESAANGGAIFCSRQMTLVNCILFLNSGFTNGGAISLFNVDSSTRIINCTFTLNEATNMGCMGSVYKGGGALHNYNSSPTIINCIFWADIAGCGPEILNTGISAPTISYCDISGGWNSSLGVDGGGNFGSGAADDPKFTANYHLGLYSGCVDRGLPNPDGSLGVPAFDIDGNPRPIPAGGRYDVGADERLE